MKETKDYEWLYYFWQSSGENFGWKLLLKNLELNNILSRITKLRLCVLKF